MGSADCAEILVGAGGNVNPLTKSGKTPLHMGAEAGMIDFVKFIMQAGADATLRDQKAQTAYDLAKKGGHKEIMVMVKTKANSSGCCCCVTM